MMRNLLPLLLSLILGSYAQAEGAFKYYHLDDNVIPNVKCEAQDCYSDVKKSLDAKELSREAFLKLGDKNEMPGTQIATLNHHAEATIVVVHGLFENSSQFQLRATEFLHLGFNVIFVTLPGHGPDAANHGKVSYKDWMRQVAQAANLGLKMGSRLIFYGQSTGGLLAYWYSQSHPQSVVAEYLLEPAFKVQDYIVLGACGAKGVIASAQDINRLSKLFTGRSTEKIRQPISLNMGCEVYKMTQSLFGNQLAAFDSYKKAVKDTSNKGNYYGAQTPTEGIAMTFNTPTEILVSKGDTVVDSDFTKLASKSSSLVNIIEITKSIWGEKEKVQHGYDVSLIEAIVETKNGYDSWINPSEIGFNSSSNSFQYFAKFLEKVTPYKAAMKNHFDQTTIYTEYKNIPTQFQNYQKALTLIASAVQHPELVDTSARDITAALNLCTREQLGSFNYFSACSKVNGEKARSCVIDASASAYLQVSYDNRKKWESPAGLKSYLKTLGDDSITRKWLFEELPEIQAPLPLESLKNPI